MNGIDDGAKYAYKITKCKQLWGIEVIHTFVRQVLCHTVVQVL